MVKPIVPLPMVICCGRLVVVSSIPPGDFFFVFFWQICCFSGQSPCSSAVWVHPKKRSWGIFPCRSGKHAQTPEIALLALKTTRFAIAVWAVRGAFFGRTGRFEPPDVTPTSGNVALWTSRALKYLKYHRAGRSNERAGGCAAKKSPFLPKWAEQAKKKAKKGPKSE